MCVQLYNTTHTHTHASQLCRLTCACCCVCVAVHVQGVERNHAYMNICMHMYTCMQVCTQLGVYTCNVTT